MIFKQEESLEDHKDLPTGTAADNLFYAQFEKTAETLGPEIKPSNLNEEDRRCIALADELYNSYVQSRPSLSKRTVEAHEREIKQYKDFLEKEIPGCHNQNLQEMNVPFSLFKTYVQSLLVARATKRRRKSNDDDDDSNLVDKYKLGRFSAAMSYYSRIHTCPLFYCQERKLYISQCMATQRQQLADLKKANQSLDQTDHEVDSRNKGQKDQIMMFHKDNTVFALINDQAFYFDNNFISQLNKMIEEEVKDIKVSLDEILSKVLIEMSKELRDQNTTTSNSSSHSSSSSSSSYTSISRGDDIQNKIGITQEKLEEIIESIINKNMTSSP